MNFLVSCVGAFDGSGTGTGAFVLAGSKRISLIDSIDSTGLYRHGDLISRVIRKLKIVVTYDMKGVRAVTHIPEVEDAHDILVDESSLYCVSTGTNSIFVYDHFGGRIDELKLPGDGDAWHINCLRKVNGKLYCSAFGVFHSDREWSKVDYSNTGLIFEVASQRAVHSGLNAPHNPLFMDGEWMVCNSLNYSLSILGNNVRAEIDCGGFTRGLAVDDHNIFVGVSANRKTSSASTSKVLTLDRRTYKVLDETEIPYPEIYDIIPVSQEEANSIKSHIGHFSIERFYWQDHLAKFKAVPHAPGFFGAKRWIAGSYYTLKKTLNLNRE